MTPFVPRLVTDFDLARVPAEFTLPAPYTRALVVVRHGSVALGPVPLDSLEPSPLEALNVAVQSHLSVNDGLIAEAHRQQEIAVAEGPLISVVVSTMDREPELRVCLQALVRQQYPRFEVVVVDNTSGSAEVHQIVVEFAATLPVRLIVEPDGGLSRARNRGVSAAQGSVVAFIDDDAVPTDHWLTELAAGYVSAPRVAAVNGAILPGKIETPAQELYLQYGGHSKGRGFNPSIIDPSVPGSQSPFYPLPPFGAGGNMSVRCDAFFAVGGFDEALGAGTPARGAEETSLFTRLLLAGWQISYRPTAFVLHADRAEYAGLLSQMHALGTSLTAYYTSLVVRDPRVLVKLAALVPRGVRDLRGAPGTLRESTMTASFPRELVRANYQGMMRGPFAYARSRWQSRRRASALYDASA